MGEIRHGCLVANLPIYQSGDIREHNNHGCTLRILHAYCGPIRTSRLTVCESARQKYHTLRPGQVWGEASPEFKKFH
jgi:hypothetical protein